MRSLGLAALLGIALLLPVPVATAEEPDTTAPQVALDPCPETPVGEPCSRREVAWVAQEQVDPAEGLAVAGVREGDTVLVEHVYDDGSGFEPYGYWVEPYNDVVTEHDYVTEAWLGPGPHELTFYARDLAGNEATVTRTVIGPEAPNRPRNFSVDHGDDGTRIGWSVHGRGSGVTEHVLRFKGEEPLRLDGGDITVDPGLNRVELSLPLSPGRHVLRIFAVNMVGRGEARSFVFRVPQVSRAR